MTPTMDPTVFIVEKTENRTVYQSTSGEIWEILGTCNACGECEVGADDSYYDYPPTYQIPVSSIRSDIQPTVLHYHIWTGNPIGQADACLDTRYGTRLDIPVRPEMTQKLANCVLSGNYLNGN